MFEKYLRRGKGLHAEKGFCMTVATGGIEIQTAESTRGVLEVAGKPEGIADLLVPKGKRVRF